MLRLQHQIENISAIFSKDSSISMFACSFNGIFSQRLFLDDAWVTRTAFIYAYFSLISAVPMLTLARHTYIIDLHCVINLHLKISLLHQELIGKMPNRQCNEQKLAFTFIYFIQIIYVYTVFFYFKFSENRRSCVL